MVDRIATEVQQILADKEVAGAPTGAAIAFKIPAQMGQRIAQDCQR